jgi:Fe2+ or Zn2+ uptake regulation protein
MGGESWSLQRRLAEVFEMEDGPLSTLELAARLYEVEAMEVTDVQLSSVRRALNALARKGVLVGQREDNGRITSWATRAGWNAQRAARWRGWTP